MTNNLLVLLLFILFSACKPTKVPSVSNEDELIVKGHVDSIIEPIMREYNIAGMAIAVTLNGQHYFYNYGVASKETQQAVTNGTLFEIGSISKIFTATMAAYAQVEGKLSLADPVSKHLPELQGSSFDKITLLNLGTYTSGGLPLQVPEEITNDSQFMDYLKHWQAEFPAGTRRLYSNPSIGLLGMVTARSLNKSFEDEIEKRLFPALGMRHSYINIPADQLVNYAQGYSKKDEPTRVNPGIIASEAYGVKSTSTDLIRFVDANMQVISINEKLKRAITDTHRGYYTIGDMTQDLVWEQYTYPVTLKKLLVGNSPRVIFEPNPAIKLIPALAPQAKVLINKTGSTNGFGAYVAFVPSHKIGIVILANKNYPIDSRVSAAHQILTQLESRAASKK